MITIIKIDFKNGQKRKIERVENYEYEGDFLKVTRTIYELDGVWGIGTSISMIKLDEVSEIKIETLRYKD